MAMAPLYSGSAEEWCYFSTDTIGSAAVSIELIIDNFENQIGKYTPIKSHQFSVKNTLWHISASVYPDHKNADNSGYVGVYIYNDNDKDLKVNCKFEIGNIVHHFNGDNVMGKQGLGYAQFLAHKDCKNVMNDGKLIIKVGIKVLEDESILIHGKGKNFIPVSEINIMSLRMFEDKTFTDFCVQCNEVTIPCHKVFLALSPVLKAMMESNMKESINGTLELDNYTETVAESFVKFFYTGQVDRDVLKESAVSFLDLGEKYDLAGLKDIAEQAMIANLDKENMISFLLAGDLYNGEKIRAAAKTFLVKNRRSLIDQEGWKDALKEKHDLVLELMESFSAF